MYEKTEVIVCAYITSPSPFNINGSSCKQVKEFKFHGSINVVE
jgi:hypothetical protein